MLKLGRMDSFRSWASRNSNEWRRRSSGVPVHPSRARVAAGTATSCAEVEDASVTLTRKRPSPAGVMRRPAVAASAVDEVAAEEVLVGGQIEQAVAREAEENRLGVARLLAGPCLVHGRPDGVRRFGGRDDAFDPGELDGCLEDLALGIGEGLDDPVLDEAAECRGVAVVAEAAGMDRRGDEGVAEGEHLDEGRRLGGVAEVVRAGPLGEGRARGRFDGDEPDVPATSG